MDPVLLVIGYTAFTGLTNVIGGVAGRFEHLRRGQFRSSVLHGLVAFGGGTMLAAVALVLLPEGLKSMDAVSAGALLVVGALVFLLLDEGIERRGGTGAQFVAMVMDFIPGSLALGAVFGTGGALGPVLAVLLSMNNVPQGFNSYKELREKHWSPSRILGAIAVTIPIGVASGLFGLFFLPAHPVVLAGLYVFSSGGLLYLMMHDIFPVAHQRKHWWPTMLGVLGFLAGILTEKIGTR
jgi:ZIP family zinc transporter